MPVPMPRLAGLLAGCLSFGLAAATELPPGDGPVSATSTVLEPTPVPADDALLRRLRLPPGFQIEVWARGLRNVRWLQPMANGDVYVSRREQGDVLLLRDADGDGRADAPLVVAEGLPWVHGLAEREGMLYLVTDRQVLAAAIEPDGRLQRPRVLVDDLPDAGQHPNRTLGFGPDGLLYVTVGSTCNDCRESNPMSGTIVRMQADGSAREIHAEGLRNTIGFGWHPVSGVLYGFDNGADHHGDDWPPEELNAILPGRHYGWPYCNAERQPEPRQWAEPPGSDKESFCPTTEAPVLHYTAHAAPIGWAFYTGTQFPPDYRNDAFVTMRGSWNRARPSGFRIVRVRFDGAGRPRAVEDFATGWLLDGREAQAQGQARRPAQFGRLAGIAMAADGALLVAEDQNGVIYRIRRGR